MSRARSSACTSPTARRSPGPIALHHRSAAVRRRARRSARRGGQRAQRPRARRRPITAGRSRLLAVDAVSRSDVDRLRARVQAAQAALAAANARVQSRALDVGFTQVRAPITGRISDRRIDAGNLVQGGGSGAEGTLLTTINALDPIYFSFDASEALFLKARRARESGAAPSEVEIRLQDESRLSLARPARFHRQRPRHAFGHDPPARGGRQRRPVPDTRHVRQHAAVDAAARDSAARAGFGGADRPGAQDRDGRRQGRQRRTAAGRTLGPLIDGLRVVRSGLTPADRVVISRDAAGDARRQGAGPRRQDRAADTRRGARHRRPSRSAAKRPSPAAERPLIP